MPALFDEQAPHFDERAGLPAAACRIVAHTVAALADPKPGDLLLDVGAGTGGIGIELARVVPRYIGLDESGEMLRAFRERPGAEAIQLIQANAQNPWPLRDGAVQAVFGSRSLHRLAPDHLSREARRVLRANGWLFVGQVDRDPDSPRSRLRARMRELTTAAGHAPRKRDTAHLVQALSAGEPERRTVARWSTERTLGEQIAGWRRKTELAGAALPPEHKVPIVDQLEQWATAEFGDLDIPRTCLERYVIDIIRVPS